jgi:hypothetical protein
MGKWRMLALLLVMVNPASSLSQDSGTSVFRPSYQAFKKGERLKYNIHYGPVNAGRAIFTVKENFQQINNEPHFAFKVFGRSLSGWDWFFKVRDYYRSWVDTQTLLPSKATRDVREGSYETEEKLIFQREKGRIIRNGEPREVPPRLHDLVSAIYYARCINFTAVDPGTYIPIKTFFANEVFPLGVTYKGIQTLKTKLGKFKVRVFKPELVEGRVFKGQDDMTVYVSADKNQVPLRIESKIFIGRIQADLYAYQNLKYSFTSRLE